VQLGWDGTPPELKEERKELGGKIGGGKLKAASRRNSEKHKDVTSNIPDSLVAKKMGETNKEKRKVEKCIEPLRYEDETELLNHAQHGLVFPGNLNWGTEKKKN